MHFSVLMTGISGEPGSEASEGTIMMAPEGQWRAQLPHLTPSVRGTQFSLTHTAWPILVDDFSSAETGRIAPAGHTSAHLVHSGRQYPLSYDISGCMRVIIPADGRSTWLGHTDTQSWHAVQWFSKFLILPDPAGTILVLLCGIFFYEY